jgi:Tfp pilus assembly pilus retraction ATPase PilT
MAKLDAFFKLMFDTGASDLHIVSGQPPILRVHGELERVKYDPLDDETLRQMLYEIAPEQKVKTFEETRTTSCRSTVAARSSARSRPGSSPPTSWGCPTS